MTNNVDRRLQHHQSGSAKFSYTAQRLPVILKWHLQCTSPSEAIGLEKQIKGWSHRKKSALIEERWDDLVKFSKNYTEYGKQD